MSDEIKKILDALEEKCRRISAEDETFGYARVIINEAYKYGIIKSNNIMQAHVKEIIANRDRYRKALEEIAMYGMSEPNVQAKIAFEALNETSGK